MAWTRLIQSARAALGTTHSSSSLGLPRFYSKPATYFVKVGIPEFLGGIGRGAETHITKIETEIGDLHKLLVTRTLRLKKLGKPCKHVLSDKGYDGAAADVWSCGVILFVLMAGYLPFDEPNLMTLYKRICKAGFS